MRAIAGFLSIAVVAAHSTTAAQIAPVPPPLAPKTVKRPVVAKPTAMPPFAPLAVTYVYNAVPQSAPPDRLGTVPIGVNWVCDQAGCKTIAAWPQPVVAGCAALARQIGPIASYGRSGAMLSAAQLNECNRGIQGAAMMPVPSSTTPSNAGQTAQDTSPAGSTSSPTQPTTEVQPGSGSSGSTPSSSSSSATSTDANSGAPASGSATTTTVTSTDANLGVPSSDAAVSTTATATDPNVVPAAAGASTDGGAASAPSSAMSTAAVATGVHIVVGEFAIVGGIQRTLDPTLGELTLSASELSLVGGAQGTRPTEPPPLSIRVPELMITGR